MKNKDTWILVILFIALVGGMILLAGPKQRKEITISTSYNPDRFGVKAFYTLLDERLGYNTDRLFRPYTDIPKDAKILIVVQPEKILKLDKETGVGKYKSITPDESDALKDWVKNGGTVIFASDDLQNVPAAFGWTRNFGKGNIYAFNSKNIITNKGMRNYKNALSLLEIINRHGGDKALVLFDEYHHGIEHQDTLWNYMNRNTKVCLALLVLAAIIAAFACGRRFGAVRELPISDSLRPGYEYIDSVGRLYQRAGATNMTLDIVFKSFKSNLCAKLGITSDATARQIADRLKSGNETAAKTKDLIERCEKYNAGHKLPEKELLDIAKEIRQLEKELGLELNIYQY